MDYITRLDNAINDFEETTNKFNKLTTLVKIMTETMEAVKAEQDEIDNCLEKFMEGTILIEKTKADILNFTEAEQKAKIEFAGKVQESIASSSTENMKLYNTLMQTNMNKIDNIAVDINSNVKKQIAEFTDDIQADIKRRIGELSEEIESLKNSVEKNSTQITKLNTYVIVAMISGIVACASVIIQFFV